MTEHHPTDSDPVERFFKAVRRGMRSFVANIADKVEQEIQEYEPDERHKAPSADEVIGNAFAQMLNVTTGLFVSNDDEPSADDGDRENESSEEDNSLSSSEDSKSKL